MEVTPNKYLVLGYQDGGVRFYDCFFASGGMDIGPEHRPSDCAILQCARLLISIWRSCQPGL